MTPPRAERTGRGAAVGRVVLLVAVLGWAASGVYAVDSDESGVAFVLGRAVARDVPPGIHWNAPWPLGRVHVARTATNFTMPIGFRFIEDGGAPPVSDLWLTGDTNVVTGRLTIQYRIASLADFALAHEDPRELLRRAGERALTRSLIGADVDTVLTTGRGALLAAVRADVQHQLEDAGVGIEVQSVTVEELSPPRPGGVRSAFQEVQNARADRERTQNEARAYRAQALAEAAGEADRLRSDAQAERYRRIEIARGEAQRFAALAHEHERAPDVTEERLYLETLERLLPRVETYVVEPGPGGKVNVRVVR
jgi:membrane protease subunit HflK